MDDDEEEEDNSEYHSLLPSTFLVIYIQTLYIYLRGPKVTIYSAHTETEQHDCVR